MNPDLEISRVGPILFEYFQSIRHKKLDEVLDEFPIKIKIERRLGLKLDGALLSMIDDREWLIEIPLGCSSTYMQYFLIYHELAHAVLKINGIVNIRMNRGYWIQEAWCDNFALAKVLAMFGLETIVRVEDSVKFFSATDQENDGIGRNIAMAKMIDGFCKDTEESLELFWFRQSFIQPTLF